MIEIPHVTLLHMAYSPSMEHLNKACRVIRFLHSFIKFKETILMTYKEPVLKLDMRVVQVPSMNFEAVQIFLLKCHPLMLSGLVMTIHDDGFPFNESMWSPEFLDYDFIGAPWENGTVGNAGFCIQSDKYRQALLTLPFVYGGRLEAGADHVPNRVHRAKMEAAGVRYAPTDVAHRFSTECDRHNDPSFGFHGNEGFPKNKVAWKVLQEWENANV